MLLAGIIAMMVLLAGCMHEDGGGGNNTADDDGSGDDGMFGGNNTTVTDTNNTTAPGNNTTAGSDNGTEEFVADVLLEVTMRDIGTGGYSMQPNQLSANQGENVSLFVKAHANNLQGYAFILEGYNLETDMLSAGGQAYVNFSAEQAGEFAYYSSNGQARSLGMEGTLTITGTS